MSYFSRLSARRKIARTVTEPEFSSFKSEMINAPKPNVPSAKEPAKEKLLSNESSTAKPIETRNLGAGTSSISNIFEGQMEFNSPTESRFIHDIYLARCPWCGVKPSIHKRLDFTFEIVCRWTSKRFGVSETCPGPHPEPEKSREAVRKAWNLSVKLYVQH